MSRFVRLLIDIVCEPNPLDVEEFVLGDDPTLFALFSGFDFVAGEVDEDDDES